ncbi:MAG: sensor histidine kinase [Anaerolineaceae bacterium]|nr:sensor histidine kinase [Anaerolineaceae bacterium]
MVLFLYGLVFFILGLAISLQSRRHSRLALARSLGWLAVFGVTHGLHAWGQLFVPLQATYMNHAGVSLLQIFQVLLQGLSFAALFQFGADLLRDRWPRLVWLPLVVTGGWLLWLLGLGLFTNVGVGLWQQQASIWAGYLLALPGALLTAYGLRHQAEKQIKPLDLTPIYSTLRVAGLAFVAFAVLAGLFGAYADYFPPNWINQTVLTRWVGVPEPMFRSLTGLVILISIIRAMEVFDLEIDQMIEEMEIAQRVAAERDHIGRELHDGAIQMAYTAGLIVESARRKLADEDVVAQRLDRAMTALNEAIASLRAYMSDLRTAPTTVSLAEGLQRETSDPRFTTLMDVSLQWEVPETAVFTPIQTTHILAIVGEALSNAARHAQANRVAVKAAESNGTFYLDVTDNGIGFNFSEDESGYGLRNMRDRARLLGGQLLIDSSQNQGTRILLTMPKETTETHKETT